MGSRLTKAIQAHDVIAMAKHYVVNDQEYERFRASVEVDEHVLRELYLLPFEMLVKDGGVAAIMSSYYRVRGVYATEYRYALTDILRTEWGFDGYVLPRGWVGRGRQPMSLWRTHAAEHQDRAPSPGSAPRQQGAAWVVCGPW
jgi:beta-glucosidase